MRTKIIESAYAAAAGGTRVMVDDRRDVPLVPPRRLTRADLLHKMHWTDDTLVLALERYNFPPAQRVDNSRAYSGTVQGAITMYTIRLGQPQPLVQVWHEDTVDAWVAKIRADMATLNLLG